LPVPLSLLVGLVACLALGLVVLLVLLFSRGSVGHPAGR
jgi:hypothetical protein